MVYEKQSKVVGSEKRRAGVAKSACGGENARASRESCLRLIYPVWVSVYLYECMPCVQEKTID